MDNKKDKNLTIRLIVAACTVLFGCVLITASFIVPPAGEIHPSVIAVIGELLTFAGTCFGIDTNYRKKMLDLEYKNKSKE